MPTIRNINDLEKLLRPKMIRAMEMTRDEVFEIISQKVSDYYNEPVFNSPDPTEPDYYQRTGTLMESLTGGKVIEHNNYYSFVCGFDDEYLEYRYPKGFFKGGSRNQYNGITGEQVLQAFNSSTHGYTVQGDHDYWNEALSEINALGGLDGILKRNLKRLGVPIA